MSCFQGRLPRKGRSGWGISGILGGIFIGRNAPVRGGIASSGAMYEGVTCD